MEGVGTKYLRTGRVKGQEGEMVEKQLMSSVNEGDEDASDSEDIFITKNKIKDVEQLDHSSTFSILSEVKFNNALSTHDT